MKDLMVDIETLGVGSNSVITQIGACYFDRYTGEIGEKFKENIDIKSCLKHGLEIDASTLKFWFNQPNPTFLKNTLDLSLVLSKFSDFCKEVENIWSHATFDIPIISNAYRKCELEIPFAYNSPRDIRTLLDLAQPEYRMQHTGTAHDGLDDALFQVEYCVECFKKLRK